MVLEENVLNGIFYKRKMFQPKYHSVEIKYLSVIQNRRGQLFCLRDNTYSQYTSAFVSAIVACQRELERPCISIQYIFKYLCKYSKYSDLNSFTQNA